MGKSDIFLSLCFSFIFGVFIAPFLISVKTISLFIIFGIVIIGISIIGIFWQKKHIVSIGFGLIILSFGIYSFQSTFLLLNDNPLIKLNQKQVVMVGRIIKEPQETYKNLKLIIAVEKVILESGEEISLENKEISWVIIFTNNFSNYKYQDLIKVEGVISVPQNLNGFDYQGYLAKEGIVMTMAYPKIEIINSNKKLSLAQFFYSNILNFKSKMRTQIQNNLPPLEAAVISAMILGDSGGMSDELKQELSKSGLSHAIAISGAHIVLFSMIMFEIFLFFGLWKKQAALITIILIIIYVGLVGGMASAVRSGIMGCLLMASQLFDRSAQNERLLGFAGFLILFQNPLSLKYDLGFQLSFLAIFGIIFVAPHINYWLLKKTSNKFKIIIGIISATLAAQILTLPILVFNFGYVSTIALISNFLTAPLMPILMGLGIAFPIIGIIFPFLGQIISFPLLILTKYLLWVIEVCAKMPFATINFEIGIFTMVLIYLMILFFILKQKNKSKDFF